jgi:energy-coupling factor transporter ATP-binding protein EcfA2
MELRELNMQGLPGLPGPFTITGQPGLNLILGPNGSGKTSFVRAALAILWPDDNNSGRLAAVWREGDGIWHASCADGRHVQWQHDGQPHEPPPLPPVDQSASFRLGLLDLLKLAADRSDTGLARAIRNQMAGGYDLGALLAAEKITGREGQTAATVLKDAEQQVADLRRRQQELQKDEAGLVALTRRAQAARAASGRADALKGVKDAIEKRAAFQAVSSRLAAGFPAIMDRLRAEDSRNLKMWRTRQHDLAEQRAETQRELERSRRQLDNAGLRDGGPASTVLDTARKLIEQAHRLAADLRRARADHAAAEAALDRARLSLAPWGLPDPGLAFDREALRKTARDMQSLLEARAQRDGLDRVLASAVLQVPETSAPAFEILSTGRRALQSWLGAKRERRWPWVPLAAGLALVGLGIARQPWSSAEGEPIGWIALLAGIVTLAAGSIPRLLATDTRRARLAFGETGLPEPDVWTDPEVRRRLAELADQEVEALLERQRQRLREELNPLRDQAARAAGDDQPSERLDGAELLYRSAAYCEALSVCDETEARCRLLGDDLAQIIAAVGNDLAAWSSDAPAREAGDLQAMETAV